MGCGWLPAPRTSCGAVFGKSSVPCLFLQRLLGLHHGVHASLLVGSHVPNIMKIHALGLATRMVGHGRGGGNTNCDTGWGPCWISFFLRTV